MSIVICKLPKAGLGNLLFPLLKAYTFAHLNQLQLIVTGYHQIKVGPWLRGEKTKRNYRGFFTFQKNIVAGELNKLKLKKYRKYIPANEPCVRITENINCIGYCYVYSDLPHYSNYFKGLKENRPTAIKLLFKMIRPAIIEKLAVLRAPCIGVHIRMGDYRKPKSAEDFGKFGSVRTPELYFIDVIKRIRTVYGSLLPVSVFTDGYREELDQLFSLENIQIVEGNNDMVDMLLLSKSKIIVTSAGSTFSYWSAFISDAPVIMHPYYIFEPLRPIEVNMTSYEGPFDENNEQLTRQIRAIQYV